MELVCKVLVCKEPGGHMSLRMVLGRELANKRSEAQRNEAQNSEVQHNEA